jgi:hypothetical protein
MSREYVSWHPQFKQGLSAGITRNHKGLDQAKKENATQWDSSEDFSKSLI